METVSIVEAEGVWRVSFNGRAMGDSRGYCKVDAWREAEKIVADEIRWSARDNRAAELRLGGLPK